MRLFASPIDDNYKAFREVRRDRQPEVMRTHRGHDTREEAKKFNDCVAYMDVDPVISKSLSGYLRL